MEAQLTIDELLSALSHALDIIQTSLFQFRSLREPYENPQATPFTSRVSNPTLELAERKIAPLKRTEGALCFSARMGAIANVTLSFTQAGDHVICVDTAYPPYARTAGLVAPAL